MRVALGSRQPLSEVLSWSDEDLVTVLQELVDLQRAMEERRGR